ncbi:MAG: glutaredoxin family protein [Gammaproteobacteria bacterium]|nr:glutaredoxin family protein [Gammaproteobacteria bacterium]
MTASCGRCDDALDWLLSMPELAGRTLVTKDVVEDDALLDRYGERVPVLRVGHAELDWPFDADRLRRVLLRPSPTSAPQNRAR